MMGFVLTLTNATWAVLAGHFLTSYTDAERASFRARDERIVDLYAEHEFNGIDLYRSCLRVDDYRTCILVLRVASGAYAGVTWRRK